MNQSQRSSKDYKEKIYQEYIREKKNAQIINITPFPLYYIVKEYIELIEICGNLLIENT